MNVVPNENIYQRVISVRLTPLIITQYFDCFLLCSANISGN